MNKKIDILLSIIFYALGLVCLFLADLYVTENFDKNYIADWAFYKSTIIILGSSLLLGYDQVFVRDPSLVSRFFKKFITQALSIALVGVILVIYFKNISIEKGIYLYISVLSFGCLNYLSASSRAYFNLWKSQFSTNFWKVVLLFCLFWGVVKELSFIFLLALSLTLIISFFLRGYRAIQDVSRFEKLSSNDSRAIATTFFLSNLTLILAIHGEQFLINLSSDTLASAHLFRYFTVFSPIALSFNGFLGFYLAPKVRRDNNTSFHNYVKLTKKVTFFSILITSFSAVIGYIYLSDISSNRATELDIILILTILTTCIIRGIYVSSSVFLGVYSDKFRLKKVTFLFIITTIFYVLGIFFILQFLNGIQAARAISVLSLLNWLLRLLFSNIFTVKSLKEING